MHFSAQNTASLVVKVSFLLVHLFSGRLTSSRLIRGDLKVCGSVTYDLCVDACWPAHWASASAHDSRCNVDD